MSHPPGGRVLMGVAVAILVAAVMSGCGIAHTPLEVALGQAASATGSAALAVRALDDGDVTSDVAATTVADAVTEISKASSDAVTYRGPAGRERQLQETALAVIARAVRHLHQAQDDLTKSADRPRLEKALARDRDRLEKLSTRAGGVG